MRRHKLSVGRCALAVVLVVATWGLIGQAAAPPPATTNDGQRTTDVQDLVFLGDARPVHIRLHIQIDSRAYQEVSRAAWDEYVRALFRQLDQNGDGVLSEAEAQRIPPPPQMASGGSIGRPTNLAFNLRVVDANDDGKIDLPELLAYYREYGSVGLRVNRATPSVQPPGINGAVLRNRLMPPTPAVSDAAVNDALFRLLDTNKDGKLSADELAAAEKILMPLDSDGDGLLVPAELVPGLNTAAQVPGRLAQPALANTPAAPSPFVFLGQGDDAGTLARRLLQQYGRRGGAQARKLSREDLGLDADTFRRLDTNGDGALDAAELEKFTYRPADVELLVRLGETRPGLPSLEVVAGRPMPAAVTVRPSGDGTLFLTCGNTRIELRANVGRPLPVPRLRALYLARFHAADAGRKGYLTPKDAEAAGFFPGQFALLDQNGDGRLTEQELLRYLDDVQTRQARALTSLVSVLVSDEGHGLFDLLDRNRDGALGLREIRGASRLAAELGHEKEGLSRSDLPHSYQIAVGLYQASFNRFGGRGTFSPRGLPLLTLDWCPPNLVWFEKMDRNRDGDVSWKEFLGSREDFRRLDANGDGLISVEEALRASR